MRFISVCVLAAGNSEKPSSLDLLLASIIGVLTGGRVFARWLQHTVVAAPAPGSLLEIQVAAVMTQSQRVICNNKILETKVCPAHAITSFVCLLIKNKDWCCVGTRVRLGCGCSICSIFSPT